MIIYIENEMGIKSQIVPCDSLENDNLIVTPKKLPFFNKMIVYNIACGGNHLLFLTTPYTPLNYDEISVYKNENIIKDNNVIADLNVFNINETIRAIKHDDFTTVYI